MALYEETVTDNVDTTVAVSTVDHLIISDGLTTSDAQASQTTYTFTFSEPVALTESYGTLETISIAESLGFSAAVVPGIPVAVQAAMYISSNLSPNYILGAEVASNVYVLDRALRQRYVLIEMLESVGITDAAGFTGYGLRLADRLSVSGAPAAATMYHLMIQEIARISDAIRRVQIASVEDQITLDYALSYVIGLSVIEKLGISSAVIETLRTTVSVEEQFQVLDSVRKFIDGTLVDSIGMTTTVGSSTRRRLTLSDGVAVAENIASKLLLRLEITDDLTISDADVLQMIYDGRINENVSILAAHIAPSGSITTWAVNTRTTAITEYSNYDFNSFAELSGKYIAASPNGLYELSGDNDDGTDIIAQIKTGIAQMGGSRYTSFKAAYLGARGEGDYVLKLETGDGKTYTYSVTANDMETTKINLGKGLRARYFSFELISTGQDFDLDTLEFVPIVAQRRV